MKVAFVSPGWPYGQNGVISYTRSISRALHELGHEVSILTFHANGSLGFETVVPLALRRPSLIHRLAGRLTRRLRPDSQQPDSNPVADVIVEAVMDLQRRGRIDVLEMEESFGWCGIVAERTPVPVIARLHGPYFLTGVYDEAPGVVLDQHRLRAEGECIDKVAALTAPSHQVLEATRTHYGHRRDAHVIPNPIPIDEGERTWSLDQCDRDALLFVGRTDNRKGGDLVIRSFVELAASRPRLKLHFVGPDKGFVDSLPGEPVSDYIRRTVPPDVQPRIIVHGALAPAEIVKLRLAARVTLMASRYENFPMAALEALAAGCPLVTTAVGGMSEVVTDGETGLLCSAETSEELTSKVSRLLDDDGLSIRLGSAGRQACIDRFHPMIVARQTLEVYSAVLGSGRVRASA